MRTVDVVDLLSDVLPRRWVRAAMLLVVGGMLVTGSAAPLIWYATERAAALQEDLIQPMFDRLLEQWSPPVVIATPKAV